MRVAFCVVSSNNSYVYKAIITLLSIKRHNLKKDFSYFVCGSFSNKYKKVVEKYDLQVMSLNLENVFNKFKELSWPKEVFYTCSIPENCYKSGFDYSVILDGDVLCLKEIPLNKITSIREVGFIKIKENKFLSNKKVMEVFQLSEKDLEKYCIDSGVGIYNNKTMFEKQYEKMFVDYYNRLSKIIYFEGDQEIINLLCIKLFEVQYLDYKFNCIFLDDSLISYYHKYEINIDVPQEEDIIFIHYTYYKPWINSIFWPKIRIFFRRSKKFQKKYICFVKETFGFNYHKFIVAYSFLPLVKKIFIKFIVRVTELTKSKNLSKKFMRI